MGLVLQQNVCWMVKVCVFACCLLLQGSAVTGISTSPPSSAVPALSPSGEQTPTHVSHGKGLRVSAPTSASQTNGTILHPPPPLPLLNPVPGPQLSENTAPPLLTNAPSSLPPYNSSPSEITPTNIVPALPPSDPYKRPRHPEHRVHGPEAPDSMLVPSPSSRKSPVPGSMPPSSHQNKAPVDVPLGPEMNTPAPRTTRHNPPPTQLVKPVAPPTFLPEPVAPPPGHFQGTLQPVQPTLPKEPPSGSPGIKPRRAGKPVAVPMNGTSNHHPPLNLSPANAPHTHKGMGSLNSAPPPLPHLQPAPSTGLHSPASLPPSTIWIHPHSSDNVTAPGPPFNAVSPHASTKEAQDHQKPDRKTNLGHHASPPLMPEGHNSSGPSPSPTSPPEQTKFRLPSPKVTTRTLPRNQKMPFQALPPPPPNADCASLTCSDPLTNSPPGPLCVCVLPIQVEVRLSVALYTFFPLVSELAAEISAGVFMKQSQVRIMGANEASQDPEKTIVLINLVPLGEKFDNTTAYLTFTRFWHKQVYIKASVFGNYEVLYVRYPGLPPSPPSAYSDIGVIDGDPYNNHGNSATTLKPLGVDVSRMGHKNGPNKSVIAAIVLSASVAVILCCAVAWVLLFKKRERFSQPDRAPPKTILSLAKSSAALMVGSGPSSVSLSYGSSVAAYTGSTKTFSSREIERATDNFNETRVLGEGGFGRVFDGVLDDGTKVAVKILKRDDDQGGREFLAEVEMLSRLHHRNLVKLIGICIEDHSHCLVYELVPNGSVESHLHGVDKETAPLDWASRLKIALGAARGLAYLHEDSSPRVIHRDFKSSNILLDHDFMPKVSDFGLARTALDEKNTHISTRVMGTFGYVAPEYAMTGHLLVKSDVYSYGVVLLELLTGRKPVNMSQPPGQENLVSWARPLLTSEEGLSLIVDPSLGPDFPLDSVTKVAAIASMCVEPEVSNRPFMGEVVQALKLVCNECDETKELGSRSYSQEDLPVDMDARISGNSQYLPDPLCTESPVSHYDCGLDLERGLSMSELLSSSMQYERPEYETHRRHSSSGPLRTKNTRQMWEKIRRLSTGSVSEHVVFRLWPESR